MPDSYDSAQLVAIDWGTTNARSFLLAGSASGPVVLDQRTGQGILAVPTDVADRDDRFEAILDGLVGPWLDAHPGLPMITCGMVGAAQGWRPAPYRTLPTPLASGTGLTTVQTARGPLPIIAGVKKSRPNADVMRGEETQLAGLAGELDPGETALVVMPGTHTKWALLRDDTLLDFDTAMSGELYSLLVDHSMVGRVAEPPVAGQDWRAGFEWGLRLAVERRALAFQAFVIRSSVLDGQLPPGQVPDAISGLLIGAEVADRVAAIGPDLQPVRLVGGAALVERYAHALAAHEVRASAAAADVTIRGLWRSAIGAGLVPGSS